MRYYLDARKPSRRPDGKFPLKLAVTKRGDTAMMPVLAYATREEWDADRQRIRGRNIGDVGALNTYLTKIMLRAEEIVRELIVTAEGATMTALQVRDHLAGLILDSGPGISLGDYFDKVAAEKKGATRMGFIRARAAYAKADPRLLERPLSSIRPADVARVDAWLRGHLAMNTRNTYIAKLMQVLKRAHKEGRVAEDAGREVSLQYVIPKSRALSVEQLRQVFAIQPATPLQREALGAFRLSFYLRAINPKDMSMTPPDAIFNGRLAYTRSKTGKDYSVKIEPEAEALLAEWSGPDLIFQPFKGREYDNYLQDLDEALRKMSKAAGLPSVTMYWARHTFSSLMIETGSTMEIVAGALGHSYGPRVTAGYVTLQQRQIDEAVRRVFDYVADCDNK